MTTGDVIEDIYPRRDDISEAKAGSRLRGCADIVVDVHLLLREWIELIQRRSTSLWCDVDGSEDEDWLSENGNVSCTPNIAPYTIESVEERFKTVVEHTPSRREVIDTHRRAIIDIQAHKELWHRIVPKMRTHSKVRFEEDEQKQERKDKLFSCTYRRKTNIGSHVFDLFG